MASRRPLSSYFYKSRGQRFATPRKFSALVRVRAMRRFIFALPIGHVKDATQVRITEMPSSAASAASCQSSGVNPRPSSVMVRAKCLPTFYLLTTLRTRTPLDVVICRLLAFTDYTEL